jgi:hypothetical protein
MPNDLMSHRTLATGLSLFFLVILSNHAEAQSDEVSGESAPSAFDTAYISDYTNLLTTRIFLLFQNASLLINPSDKRISNVEYRPNANIRMGIAGFWRWFGLGLSIDNPFYKTDQDSYGKTSSLDLRVNAFGRFAAIEFFVQQFKGFYIDSPERPDGTHYVIPDMKTFSMGFSGYWILNGRRFSIRAAFIQNERQRRSAGSFMIRPSVLFYSIKSDRGIIPTEIVDFYQIPGVKLVTGGTFYSVGLSPGYAYTLVFLKNIYVTAAVFPGVAAHFSNYSNELGARSDFEFTFQLGSRIALGYNSSNWFLGGSVQTGFNEVPDKLSNSLFNYSVTQLRFWGGMRFDLFKKKAKR